MGAPVDVLSFGVGAAAGAVVGFGAGVGVGAARSVSALTRQAEEIKKKNKQLEELAKDHKKHVDLASEHDIIIQALFEKIEVLEAQKKEKEEEIAKKDSLLQEQKEEITSLKLKNREIKTSVALLGTLLASVEPSPDNLAYIERIKAMMTDEEKSILNFSRAETKVDQANFINIITLLTDKKTSTLIEDPVKLENGEFCSRSSVGEGENCQTDEALTACLDLIKLLNLEDVFKTLIETKYFVHEPRKSYVLFQRTIHNNLVLEKYPCFKTTVSEEKKDLPDVRKMPQSQRSESLTMYSLGLNGRVNQATSDGFVLVEQPPEEKNAQRMGMN